MRLPVGHSDFREVINSQFDFIDKSLLIKEILEDDKIILITRPRRFGKTLNLSMLRYFFSSEVNGNATRSLFDQLEICQHKEFSLYQGKHPVISVSFKDVKENNFAKAYAGICDIVTEIYHQHRYLLKSNALEDDEKALCQSILYGEAKEVTIKKALKNLTEYLHRHHGIEVVVLIDEYDTPIQSGYLCHYYEEIISFFRSFFGAGLKDNEHVFKAVLTGILRVSQESLFSGLNNLVMYSMLNSKYGSYFGFTESEVEGMLKDTGIEDQFAEVKAWYNGYQVGNYVLYNPWSIANYIKSRELQAYWINTSDNALIKELLFQSGDAFRSKFEPLLKGKQVVHLIDENFVYGALQHNRDAALWSFLLMAGYLTVTDCQMLKGRQHCRLAVPNKEVNDLYRNLIEEWLAGSRGLSWYEGFLMNLLEGKIDSFKQGLKYIMDTIVSAHDTGKEPEAFYHGLVIGITASLCDSKIYELRSNRESGDGRYDYFIVSRDPEKLSILMEFKKVSGGNDKALKEAADRALEQINVRNYFAEAEQRHVKKLLKIGIAFSGKKFAVASQQ